MLKRTSIIIGFFISLIIEVASIAQIPAKEELLSLYEKSIGMPNKGVYTVDTTQNVEGMEWPADITTHFTIFLDGERRATSGFERAKLKKTGEIADETNITRILDKRSIMVMNRENEKPFVWVDRDNDRKKAEKVFFGTMGAGMINEGILLGTENEVEDGNKRLPDYLRECANLKVRENEENIDGHPTYVFEGQSSQGKFVIWLDPNADFHPRRIELHKIGDNSLYGKPLSSYRSGRPELAGKQLKEYSVVYDSMKIIDINGLYMITEGRMVESKLFTDDSKFIITSNFKISGIDLNPDFNALKPFEVKVPDGTPVSDGDFPGGRFEVRQGKIVSAGTAFEEIDKQIDQLKQQQ
jgi:hypothetical protein